MVPSQRPHPHGPPLLRWLCSPGISHLHRSYSALRLPSPLPPRCGYPSLRWDSCTTRFFFAGPFARLARRACGRRRAHRRLVTGSPFHRLLSRARQGSPRCLGRPLCARHGQPPRRIHLSCPYRIRWCCLQGRRPLDTRSINVFGAVSPRLTHSRAYASPLPLPRPAQGSLPAGAGPPLPGGFRTRWTTLQNFKKSSHPSILSDQPCLVAPLGRRRRARRRRP